jgi:hypothetical protein
MEQSGHVAVMHRWDSRVIFQDTPMTSRTPNRENGKEQNVSFCFAVIRPNAQLAERNCQLMAQNAGGDKKERLSDQALLAEVLRSDYLEMNHDIVMFPSWLSHSKVNEKRSCEILKAMEWTSFRTVTKENVSQFVKQFGAVHFSNVFAPEWQGSTAQKYEAMRSVSGDELIWNTHSLEPWIFKDDYLSNFVLPLWLRLRNIYAEKKTIWQ